MTPMERYLAALAGRVADRVPCVPIVMQFAAEFIGSNYGAFAADHRVLVEANIRCAEHFGFDQLSAISDPYRETQGFGGAVEYVRDGVPHCTAPLADTTDLSLLKRPDPAVSDRMRDRVDAVREYRRRCGNRYSVLGWVEGPAAEAADLRTPINFLCDLMDDEEGACRLMDRCLEVAIEFGRAQIEAGADTIGIGDAIASQVSPDVYHRLIQPREKTLVEALQSAGGRVRLHICGDITHLLPGLAELRVDVLDVDHMVDLARVREAVGPEVALAGNFNPVEILRGTPDSIRRGRDAALKAAGRPCLVNAGCEIPAGTPVENLLAFCEPVAW